MYMKIEAVSLTEGKKKYIIQFCEKENRKEKTDDRK